MRIRGGSAYCLVENQSRSRWESGSTKLNDLLRLQGPNDSAPTSQFDVPKRLKRCVENLGSKPWVSIRWSRVNLVPASLLFVLVVVLAYSDHSFARTL